MNCQREVIQTQDISTNVSSEVGVDNLISISKLSATKKLWLEENTYTHIDEVEGKILIGTSTNSRTSYLYTFLEGDNLTITNVRRDYTDPIFASDLFAHQYDIVKPTYPNVEINIINGEAINNSGTLQFIKYMPANNIVAKLFARPIKFAFSRTPLGKMAKRVANIFDREIDYLRVYSNNLGSKGIRVYLKKLE